MGRRCQAMISWPGMMLLVDVCPCRSLVSRRHRPGCFWTFLLSPLRRARALLHRWRWDQGHMDARLRLFPSVSVQDGRRCALGSIQRLGALAILQRIFRRNGRRRIGRISFWSVDRSRSCDSLSRTRCQILCRRRCRIFCWKRASLKQIYLFCSLMFRRSERWFCLIVGEPAVLLAHLGERARMFGVENFPVILEAAELGNQVRRFVQEGKHLPIRRKILLGVQPLMVFM